MHLSKILLLASKSQFSLADAHYFENACFGTLTNRNFVNTIIRTDKHMRPCVSRSVLYSHGLSQKKRLENTSTPVCLVHGRNDPLIRASFMEAISNPMLYSGKTKIIENSGHAPFMDAQSEFEAILQSFIEEVVSGAMAFSYPKLSKTG